MTQLLLLLKAMYQTLNEFKAKCVFFPKGRIVPQYVLKGPKKHKHNVTFGADCWLHYTPEGHFFLVDTKSGGPNPCFVRIMITKKAKLTCHPYIPNMNTRWVLNHHSDEEILEIINRNLK